ncbi:MAG: hypothetical protein Q7J06_06155 [Bacteroidales bacterium]|nr:hypothetical protein [Bacteroidales bacterium]
MTKKKPGDTNYHKGKETGYHLINGEYHIAPLYQGQFDFLHDKKNGIEEMLAMVSRHSAQDLEAISKATRQLWDRLAEDIGIDKAAGWTYQNGVVRPADSKTTVE